MDTKTLSDEILKSHGLYDRTGRFHSLHGGSLSSILNHIGNSYVNTRYPGVRGGSIGSAGSLYSGGSLLSGGGFQQYSQFKPGEYPTFKQSQKMMKAALEETAEQRQDRLHQKTPMEHHRMDIKQMYHHILDLKPRHWELMREGASRVLGANPSRMWDHVKMNNTKPAAEPYHYQQILESKDAHEAATTLEAEDSHGGDMGFYRALRDVYDKIKHVYQQLGTVTHTYNPDSQSDVKILKDVAKLRELMNPLISSMMKLKGEANPGSVEDKIFEAILNTFTHKLPQAMPKQHEEEDEESGGGLKQWADRMRKGFNYLKKQAPKVLHHAKKIPQVIDKSIEFGNAATNVLHEVGNQASALGHTKVARGLHGYGDRITGKTQVVQSYRNAGKAIYDAAKGREIDQAPYPAANPAVTPQ